MNDVVGWLDVLKIAVSSSLLTTFGSWGLNHFFVHRAALKRDARYVAQRVAIILEKFAVDCADVIIDNDIHSESGGHAGKRHLGLPALGLLPADADWKALPPNLVDRVLSMPNELALATKAILFWWNVVGDEECMETETDQRAGTCGLRAWLLASELRKQYKIPASSLTEVGWDFVAELRTQDEAARKKAESNEAARKKAESNRTLENGAPRIDLTSVAPPDPA
jgi:hypothetical protein